MGGSVHFKNQDVPFAQLREKKDLNRSQKAEKELLLERRFQNAIGSFRLCKKKKKTTTIIAEDVNIFLTFAESYVVLTEKMGTHG